MEVKGGERGGGEREWTVGRKSAARREGEVKLRACQTKNMVSVIAALESVATQACRTLVHFVLTRLFFSARELNIES